MNTLSQMASTSSPTAYVPKFLRTLAVASVLTGVLLHLSPSPAAPPPALLEALVPEESVPEVVEKGPGLMRREKPMAKAPIAPHPEEWGSLMRREKQLVPPAGNTMGSSSLGFLLIPCGIAAVVGFGKQGTLAHMASSSSPSAYLPKFFAMALVACLSAGVLLYLSPSPEAPTQLMRREMDLAPLVENAGQSSCLLLVSLFGVMALIVFATKGTFGQMASSSSSSVYFTKLLATVVVALLLSGVLLYFSPSPSGPEQLMRREAPLEGSLPVNYGRAFMHALIGVAAFVGIAMQAKGAFMQVAGIAFNVKAK